MKLTECLNYVRSGDTLVVTKLDRIARSTLHLTQIAEKLTQKGVALEVIDQNIDTTTSTGKLLFNMLSSIAEFETAIRAERQMDGIKKAKENGIHFGRKAKLSPTELKEIKKLRSQGVLIRELMQKYGLSKNSVFRLLRSPEREEILK